LAKKHVTVFLMLPPPQRRTAIKAILNLIVAALLIAGLTGCAATSTAHAPMKAKCPACGHEFVVPGAVSGGP
jgi:anaerobic selenocysteine-containing dehydrogenase